MIEERFARDGLLILERLLPPDLLNEVAATILSWTGPIDLSDPPPHARVDERRLHMPVRMEGPLLDPRLWANPTIEILLSAILGQDYLLDSAAVVTALPGAPMMHLHRDHDALYPATVANSQLPAHAVSMVVPLIETDDSTGTTAFARGSTGSTKTGTGRLEPDADWVAPQLKLGGCVLMDYRLWHRGLPNRSERERPILYLTFARPWFTDTVNFNAHPRMQISREDLMSVDPVHRYRLRRAAAAGLIDATPDDLGIAAFVAKNV